MNTPTQQFLNAVRETAIARYFGSPIEIVGTCCDGALTTIRKTDGTKFQQYSHGGWVECETITVRSHLIVIPV